MDKGIEVKLAQGDYSYKSYAVEGIRICPQCGEKYIRYKGEIEYQVKLEGKTHTFCSWNCKCKFRKEHADEIEAERAEIEWWNSCEYIIRTTNERTRRWRTKSKEKTNEVISTSN